MATQANVMTIPAKYENGVFRPLEYVAIKEGTLVEVHVPAESEPDRKRRSIKDLPFYGMWADREDITDGVSYVNALRNNPRG
jgi:predicted DNA-binding antitoxin AbrB/MazE fold protein